METSVQDRFANLFASGPLPAPPESTQSHLFQKEQPGMTKQTGWEIPEVAQNPRQVGREAPRPAGGDDMLTSSDDDEYVTAFSQKPKMQVPKKSKNSKPKPKPRKLPEATACGSPPNARIEAKGHIEYVPNGKYSAGIEDDDDDWEPTPHELPTMDKLGNPVSRHFCQFNLVAKFPYKYMVDSNDRVSRHFFANNKFFERTWDLYYIHPPESLYARPVLLLPHTQVQELIDEIATRFEAEVSVPAFPFTLSFFADGTPQPQFLGTTHSRAAINEMQDSIPSAPGNHGETPPNVSPALDHSFAAFKAKMEKALAANRKKNAAVKKKKAQDRFLTIQDWCKQLRRAQRYFGLRPRAGKVPEPDPNMTWPEQEAFIKDNERKVHLVPEPLDVAKPAPFPFEKEPIIVSIDIESYERNHYLITEIGVSTLDTLDLVDLPPGPGGENWMKHIRSRHFRIKDREHLVNKEFVIGHPDEFQFGESEFINIEDAGKAIDQCFGWPFSIEYKHDGHLKNVANSRDNESHSNGDDTPQSNGSAPAVHSETDLRYTKGEAASVDAAASTNDSDAKGPTSLQLGPKHRTVLLLGHDIQTDLTYLSSLNSIIFSAPRPSTYPQQLADPSDTGNPLQSILEALDTAILYKVLCRESQTRSLTSVMGDLGRTAWYAHCGGNDARYTLEALVGLVIKARLQDDEEKATRHAEVKKGLESNGWDDQPPTDKAGGIGSAHGNSNDTNSNANPDADNEHVIETTSNSTHTTSIASSSQTNRPSAPAAWQAEKSGRLATRLAATQREVEEEFDAWDAALAPPPTATAPKTASADDGNEPVPFQQTLQNTFDAKQKKAPRKTAEEKRREWEMRVREEDGVEGPVDWAVGGRDGVGK